MRSLATLGGVLVLIVLAIAWRISNKEVDASHDADPDSGIVTLGIEDNASKQSKASGGLKSGQPNPDADSNLGSGKEDVAAGNLPENDPAMTLSNPPGGERNTEKQPSIGPEIPIDPNPADDPGAGSGPESGAASPPPKPEPTVLSYTVKDGDTLYRILMNAYGAASPDLIEAIASANEMDDPGAITPGDVLKLPEVEGFSKPKLP
jgi:nucleoid-associated protein YgaU